MAFNLYQPENISEPIERAFGGTYNRMEQAAQQKFGGATGQRIRGSTMPTLNRDSLMEAVEMFGIDTFLNWDKQGGDIVNSIKNSAIEAKKAAVQSRLAGNLQDYARNLQSKLYDMKAQTYSWAMNQAEQGQIISAIVGFISSLGGGVVGKALP